jgi:signal transduction histidine kinase
MPITKAKVILLILIGSLTAASPNILRILAMILLLIYIIRYREDESVMRMVSFVAVGYSVALFPSPWYALAAGIMLYLIYKRWDDAGFLGLLSGLSMVSAYAFYTFAEQKLGWFYGIRLFYTDAVTSLIIHGVLFATGTAVVAISTFLIFMKIVEETSGYAVTIGGEEEAPREKPKRFEIVHTSQEEKKPQAEVKEEKAAQEEERKEEEKPPAEEKKKAKVWLPRSVEI